MLRRKDAVLLNERHVTIRKAQAGDANGILGLLARLRLPLVGVRENLDGFIVAVDDHNAVCGVMGLEEYGGDTALLRSAAVEPDAQHQGIARTLLRELLHVATSRNIRRLVLLTTTAEGYFQRQGFHRVERASITGLVTQSAEFKEACPSTAVCMERWITPAVLVLCTGNSCRSQMAEGILRFLRPSLRVVSAGTSPAREVHPLAIEVMGEIGISMHGAKPKDVALFLQDSFSHVITLCDHARNACPVFAGSVGTRLHLNTPDPAGMSGTRQEQLEEFRRVRDHLFKNLGTFVAAEVSEPA